MPLDKKYTGQKKLKSPSDEKIPKPKMHTMKNIRNKQKELDYYAKEKIRLCAHYLNLEKDIYGNYDSNRLSITTWFEAVFSSQLEAKTFIKIYEKQILNYASNKEETNNMEVS